MVQVPIFRESQNCSVTCQYITGICGNPFSATPYTKLLNARTYALEATEEISAYLKKNKKYVPIFQFCDPVPY